MLFHPDENGVEDVTGSRFVLIQRFEDRESFHLSAYPTECVDERYHFLIIGVVWTGRASRAHPKICHGPEIWTHSCHIGLMDSECDIFHEMEQPLIRLHGKGGQVILMVEYQWTPI